MNRIVPIFPWPMHPKVAEILEAMPDVTPVEALPGGPGPVLAIRTLPTFICDAVLITRPERVADGVHIVTSDGIEMVSMREMLGAGDEFIEPAVQKVRFQ